MAMKSSFVSRLHLASARGMTLVEMMVALVVTLIMMGAVITVFGFIGETVTDSRSIIETNDRLRSAAHRLREDLGSVTATMVPPLRPESGMGYFEIIEGDARSYPTANRAFAPADRDLITGDYDDALLFTIRSGGEPFRGKSMKPAPTPGTGLVPIDIESPTAEVAWYLRPGLVQGGVQTYVLCRKLMLIVPELPANQTLSPNFYVNYDVSARRTSATNLNALPNTLGDLTKRENRFAHHATFPHALLDLPVSNSAPPPLKTFEETGLGRAGEDVVLTNVLGMDVQVWDPAAPLRKFDAYDKILTPSDPAYGAAKNYPATKVLQGAYVDLGSLPNTTTFMSLPNRKSGLMPPGTGQPPIPYCTYDTWSFHYEHDGVRQSTQTGMMDTNNQPIIDAGTNGIDDNAMQSPGIDDVTERETMPPYPLPLRGIRVTLRVYEPSSRQVREVTVVESFVPE
jgi:prepilin-type N-terminal cleavage/methylation domain-containing protein